MTKKPPPLSRHAVTAPTDEQGERITDARRLPIEMVRPNPWQPRQHADPMRLDELAADVASRGILEPIIVRPIPEEERDGLARFEVVAGERRYRAALQAGLTYVPAIVRKDMSEEEAREASLVENLLREDLDIEDEARFLKALYEQKGSLRAVGDAIHKSYQYVNRRLKLLENPVALLAYREGLINLDHLIGGHPDDPTHHDDITLSQENGSTKEDPVTERNTTGEPELEEVRFYRTRSSFKPFQKLQLHVRRLHASSITNLPPEDRPRLRQTIHDLIDDLSRLEEALATEPPPSPPTDIQLEAHPDGTPGWSVRHDT
jgi:ParB/RepB/Spo0J family partition protein